MRRSTLTATAGAFFALLVFSSGAPLSPLSPPSPGVKPEKRPAGATEITAREATFDNRTHEATFTGDVIVTDPEFGLSCEKLDVYLKKPVEKPIGDPKPKDDAESGGGIDRAIAEVNVIITMDKLDADKKKKRYIGRAKKAVFDNTSGILTLTGWPQIAESVSGSLSKQIVSREENCVIVIDRAGKIDVKGIHTSTLKEVAAPEPASR